MKPQLHNNFLNKNLNQQGFTLIEILVALVLVAFVMAMAITNPFTGGHELENQVNDLERAIRFMSDEAALRNAVTRLHINLDRDPQEYSVEYGPSSQFVLPAKETSEINVVTKEEEEKKKKETKEFNMKFARISEFQDSNKEFEQNVKLIAVGTSQSSTLQVKGDYALYSFPSGEKDEVFIALAFENSVATITTSAFSSKIIHNYYHLDKGEEKESGAALASKAKELFEIWLKDKK